jgi:hypothetical protein
MKAVGQTGRRFHVDRHPYIFRALKKKENGKPLIAQMKLIFRKLKLTFSSPDGIASKLLFNL